MDDILGSANLDNGSSIHIGTLSRQTIVDAGAEHLGFNGYFVFEAHEMPGLTGISVLGKASSLEAAFRLIDIWAGRKVDTPRDIIAGHMRNWGKTLAYGLADTLITELSIKGFHVVKEAQSSTERPTK